MTTSAAPINRFPYWDAAEDFDPITRQELGSPMFDEEGDDEVIGGDWKQTYREGVSMSTKVTIKGMYKRAQGPARLIAGAPGAINGYTDPEHIERTSIQKIREAEVKGEGSKARAYHYLSPVTTSEENLKALSQQVHHDPNASELKKVGTKMAHGVSYTVNRTALAPITFIESGFRAIVSLFDEVEDESVEVAGQQSNIGENSRDTVFSSTPQTLTPINLDSVMVTDAYQHQNAAGADWIAGKPNQGMDPYQAQREQYEVLA
jgi:hypothetical protein